MTKQPGDYRVTSALVEVCNGYRCQLERGFIAKRRVTLFGVLSWWWPVINAQWRDTANEAWLDAKRDSVLRTQPSDFELVAPTRNRSKETPMTDRIDSTSDERTVNNSTKQTYRRLTDAEKAQVDMIKQMGAEFIDLMHEIGGTDPAGERLGSRDLSLAVTHIEDATMRAVRHVTK